jgi:hypothetical protein
VALSALLAALALVHPYALATSPREGLPAPSFVAPTRDKPDLVIEKIDVRVQGRPAGSNPREGDTVEVVVLVKNSGSASAPSGWFVDYYLDGARVYRDGPIRIELVPGAYAVSSWVWVVPEGSAGNHTIRVVVDPTGAVDEANEANNERALRVLVEAREQYLKVYLYSARLNDVALYERNFELSVNPGARVIGWVSITVENVQPGNRTTPVVWVASWERGLAGVVAESAGKGVSYFTVEIDVQAPLKPGVYYIGFFAGWVSSPGEVASAAWNLSVDDWDAVFREGRIPERPVSGRAIRLVVLDAPPAGDLVVRVAYAPGQAMPEGGGAVDVLLTLKEPAGAASDRWAGQVVRRAGARFSGGEEHVEVAFYGLPPGEYACRVYVARGDSLGEFWGEVNVTVESFKVNVLEFRRQTPWISSVKVNGREAGERVQVEAGRVEFEISVTGGSSQRARVQLGVALTGGGRPVYDAQRTAEVEPNGTVRFSFTTQLGPGSYVLQLWLSLPLDEKISIYVGQRRVEVEVVERRFNPLGVLAPLLVALALAAAYAAARRFKRASASPTPR